MITGSTQKMIIVLVVVLVLSFFGYKMFLTTPESGVTLDPSSSQIAGQDILVLVAKLNTISINQNLFSSPLFSGLVDFSQPISSELHGRVNPFAPIGSDINSPNVVVPKQASSTKGV